jgi:hypothetical protein
MTPKEAKQNAQNMLDYKRKITASPEAAVEALKKAGILTSSGKVADPYKRAFVRQTSK